MHQTMQIEHVKIETLIPDPNNVRIHSVKNLLAITASLKEYGQQIPIVVNKENIVLKGNGSLQCMKDLGWKEVIIHRTTLEGSRGVHFAIADNRAAELAEWDLENLSLAIQADETGNYADSLLKHGWTEADIEPLRLAQWNPDEPLSIMPGTETASPPALMFFDFTEKQLSELATPLAYYRERHPSLAVGSDSELLILMAEQWMRWERKGGIGS